MKPIIAIDGPAASGKGTLARKIAEECNYAHLDSGSLYRAVAFEVLESGGNPEDKGDAITGVQTLKDRIKANSDTLSNEKLRGDDMAVAASKVAAIQSVRDMLVGIQRDFAANPGKTYHGSVIDGRDIGTVICPDAPVKFYVTADVEVRAERRTKELQSKGIEATSEAVLRDMRERDARDADRQTAPMKPAEDAIVLDTSDLNEEQMLEKALEIINSRLAL